MIAEALRHWLDSVPSAAERAAVREPAPVTYGAADVADARRKRLVAELKLTPAQRLGRAAGLGRLARAHQRRSRRAQIGDDPAVHVFTVAWKVKYRDTAARSSTVDVNGVPIPVISIEDLIETKRTGRLQDAADVEALEEIRPLRGG